MRATTFSASALRQAIMAAVLIVAVLSCLPVFHHLSGIDTADAFDQGIMISRAKAVGPQSAAATLLALALWSCVLCARRLARQARLVRQMRRRGDAWNPSRPLRIAIAMLRGPGGLASQRLRARLLSRANIVRRVTTTLRLWLDTPLSGGSSLVGARMRLNV